jgi:hypothetical protein
MKTDNILKELEKYLPKLTVNELRLMTALKGSITMCIFVTEIIKSHNSSKEKEDVVAYLLSALCHNHFSKISV